VVQERLESSVGGRVLVSVFVVVILAAVIAWNLPQSELSRQAQFRLRPVVNGAGLDQTWAVFAPDPPRQELELEARIVYEDGTERTWRVPTGDPVVGGYRDYRWLKWAEWVANGSNVALLQPAAAWIARQEQRAGRRPVSVSLIRQVYDLPIGKDRASPRPVEFYTYPVTTHAAGGAGVPAS
jgi:hypothetical protein